MATSYCTQISLLNWFTMSVQSALHQLATYRAQNTRASQDIFDKGALILQKNALHKMGDEGTSGHLAPDSVHVHKLIYIGRLGVSGTARARGDRRRTIGRCGRTYVYSRIERLCSHTPRRRQQCLRTLSDKFPVSPRVDCLTGIRMEATETPDISLKYYAELLEADPTNAVCGPTRPNVRRVLMLFFLFQGNMEAPHFDIPTNRQD